MMKVTDIHKRFGKQEVLKGIDLDVAKGEVVVLLGPSGSGKTTFLRCLNFLERADQGVIQLGETTTTLHKASKKEIDQWILINIIQPLRNTDVKEQIEKEKLRKISLEADLVEIELNISTEKVLSTDYVTQTLTGYFAALRGVLRSIPASIYVELFESEDADTLRIKLEERIDEKLRGLGSYEYEEQPEEDDEDSEPESEINITPTED